MKRALSNIPQPSHEYRELSVCFLCRRGVCFIVLYPVIQINLLQRTLDLCSPTVSQSQCQHNQRQIHRINKLKSVCIVAMWSRRQREREIQGQCWANILWIAVGTISIYLYKQTNRLLVNECNQCWLNYFFSVIWFWLLNIQLNLQWNNFL